MNINDLKELVKHCIYEEEGITCMNNTYYVDMIHTIENLQFKIDKANEILDKWGEEPDADMYMQIKEYKEWKELKDILKVEMNE